MILMNQPYQTLSKACAFPVGSALLRSHRTLLVATYYYEGCGLLNCRAIKVGTRDPAYADILIACEWAVSLLEQAGGPEWFRIRRDDHERCEDLVELWHNSHHIVILCLLGSKKTAVIALFCLRDIARSSLCCRTLSLFITQQMLGRMGWERTRSIKSHCFAN